MKNFILALLLVFGFVAFADAQYVQKGLPKNPKFDSVSIGDAKHSTGHGSPEGVVAGNVGDEYRDLDSGTVYNKTSGTGNTGWEAGAGGGVTPVSNLVSYSGGGSNAIGDLGATPALDPSLGAYQTGTVNADISSMTIASGKGVVGQSYKFELTISGTRTITWPVSGFTWMAGAPTVPADGHKLWVVLVCTATNTYEASWFDDSYYTMPASGSTIPSVGGTNTFTGTNTLGDYSNHEIVRFKTPATGGNYSGLTIQVTAGTGGISAGDVVYLESTGGTALKAKADSATTARVVCLAPAAIAQAATGDCLHIGTYKFSSSPSYTIGSPVYLSAATAGLTTTTQPTTAGNQNKRLGTALAADIILFKPSEELIEVK